jgi:heme/copper-type cytochrome/quinol oxidase subunit 1
VFLVISESALDIPIHDTYYVIMGIPFESAATVIGVILLVVALVYIGYPLFFKQQLNVKLGLLHFGATLVGLSIFVSSLYFLPMSGAYLRPEKEAIEIMAWVDLWINIGLILILLGQAVFLFNLIRSLFTPSAKA